VLDGIRRALRLPHRSPERIARDVDDEVQFHLEMRTREYIERGFSPEAAERAAHKDFGDLDTAIRRLTEFDRGTERDARRADVVGELRADIAFALRQIRRRPGFAAVVTLTLALGIGAATAIFSAVNGMLLRPLPYADADRVATLWQTSRKDPNGRDDVAPANFVDWRARSTSFDALAALEPFSMDWKRADDVEHLGTWLVSEGFFGILRATPLLGRTFVADDYVPGHGNVFVISEGIWRSKFGADRSIIGRTVTADGSPSTIIGVMPAEFRFPAGREIWAPLILDEAERKIRDRAYFTVIGRLRRGVTEQAARAEMTRIAADLGVEYPRTNAGLGVLLVPLTQQVVGQVRPALLILLGAVGLLLLIACANVANLLVARSLGREREFAIRAALGAGRGRVIRQLLTESVVLSALAGSFGVLFAFWGVAALRALMPAGMPRADEVGVDARVLAFAALISLGTALVFGLAPAVRASRPALRDGLGASGRGASRGVRAGRVRGGLVVSQVALTMVLLVGAGLLARSFVSVLRVDRGYRVDNVLAATIFIWGYVPTPRQRAVFVQQTIDRLREIPGVREAGAATSLPLARRIAQSETPFSIVGTPQLNGTAAPSAHLTLATPGFLEALGVSLRRGRLFTSSDNADSPPVILINEQLARRFFPGEDPIGKRLVVDTRGKAPPHEIIGVVGDVRQEGLETAPRPALFLPYAQNADGSIVIVVRSDRSAGDVAPPLREVLRSMNASIPIANLATMQGLLDTSMRERRFHLSLLAAFALTALVLSTVGVYAVISNATMERLREIGVRIALGARPVDVVSLVLRGGTGLTLAGIALGAVGSLATTRVLRRMLFGVTPMDASTVGAGVVLMLVLGALACLVPARRAVRVNAATLLRSD
jgi:putative ABC transport system permease protein